MTRALVIGAVLTLGIATARAHPLAFGVLDVREDARGDVEVSFRFSGTEARERGAVVEMPPRCEARGEVIEGPIAAGGTSRVARYACGAEGLEGARVAVRGMEGTGVQIATRVERADGSVVRARLDDGTRELRVEGAGTGYGALGYVALGLEHIAGGVDHLLFVLGLLLVVRGRGALVAAITGFTLGHSVTLALASLGVLSVRAAPVEACIALSIVLLAREVARPSDASLTRRAPWAVAGALGLLHGLGFASALGDAGVPRDAMLPALVGFNAGVELGQLAFVALVLAVIAMGRAAGVPAGRARAACAVAMGGVASFFLMERLVSLGA